MRGSARHCTEENVHAASAHIRSLHHRLNHALSLGNLERGKWHCSDIETQGLVLRSIEAFIKCISTETLKYSLVKDSVIQIARALQSILEFKNQSVLILATDVAVKIVNVLPSSVLKSHVLDLVFPLAELLSSKQLQVAISCAISMNVILSKLSSRQEREVWETLKETKVVGYAVQHIKQFRVDDSPSEYFTEMASLLSKILWLWPPTRLLVWNDSEFLDALESIKLMPQNSVKIAVLQLYSSIALCRNGAEKLLENGESLLSMMVGCMDNSTDSVRLEAFKFARCLSLGRGGCMKMLNICCKPLVKAVTNAMNDSTSPSEKLGKSELSVIIEAFRLASLICWVGDYHACFWKYGVDKLLLDLLLDNNRVIYQQQHELSVTDLIIMVRKSYNSSILLSFGPYVWDILGGYAANCKGIISREMNDSKLRLSALIACACISFIDLMRTLRHVSQHCPNDLSNCESVSRAVLMMVYSPCKYVSSVARSVLSEMLKSGGKGYPLYLLEIVNARLTEKKFGIPGDLQVVMSLICLACYCSLPEYRELVINSKGLETLIAFISWWLRNPVYAKRASIVPHMHDLFMERSCCFAGTEEWEGKDMLLLFGLWILAELLQHSARENAHLPNKENSSKAHLIQELKEICRGHYSHGVRWYAAYALSYFGVFGFQNKLGLKILKSLREKEHVDVKFDLANAEYFYVHEVIVAVRCPSLLPPRQLIEKSPTASSMELDMKRNTMRTVRLSASVDPQSLVKLLEYVYSGILEASGDYAKSLRILAKHCKLELLIQMLSRRKPVWGIDVPCFELTPALAPAGYYFSDLILEVGSTRQLVEWKCRSCFSAVPHMHVHKVIVESSCNYLRALFHSGMQESHRQAITVPVSWPSLNMLVTWFYSGKLPVPAFDCLWQNSDAQDKVEEMISYMELCWLSEFWLIEDLNEECYEAVVSCLDASKHLSTKIIQVAASFSQWNLARVAADYLAPSFHILRDSGELDELDDNLVEMVRAASVRFSQRSRDT